MISSIEGEFDKNMIIVIYFFNSKVNNSRKTAGGRRCSESLGTMREDWSCVKLCGNSRHGLMILWMPSQIFPSKFQQL